MVYAFMIQTVHPSFCQVLYSQVFNDESLSDDPGVTDRSDRKGALQLVADRVAIECDFLRRQRLTGSWTEGDGDQPETGMFSLDPSVRPHLVRCKHALWCSALSTAFVLLLEERENRVLAHAALLLLVKHLQREAGAVQALTTPADVLLRPDAVLDVVGRVMPDGQLLFLNSKAVKRMDRDIDKVIGRSK